MKDIIFKDRADAGKMLAKALAKYAYHKDVLVLGLPRGGVPVATEVADLLHVPLDVMVVRKLGVPEWKELAMGAIASGGVRVINERVVAGSNITPEDIEAVVSSPATRPPPR